MKKLAPSSCYMLLQVYKLDTVTFCSQNACFTDQLAGNLDSGFQIHSRACLHLPTAVRKPTASASRASDFSALDSSLRRGSTAHRAACIRTFAASVASKKRVEVAALKEADPVAVSNCNFFSSLGHQVAGSFTRLAVASHASTPRFLSGQSAEARYCKPACHCMLCAR